MKFFCSVGVYNSRWDCHRECGWQTEVWKERFEICSKIRRFLRRENNLLLNSSIWWFRFWFPIVFLFRRQGRNLSVSMCSGDCFPISIRPGGIPFLFFNVNDIFWVRHSSWPQSDERMNLLNSSMSMSRYSLRLVTLFLTDSIPLVMSFSLLGVMDRTKSSRLVSKSIVPWTILLPDVR